MEPNHAYLVLGMFYIINSLWWSNQITKRHLLCKERRMHYFSTMTFTSSSGCCQRWPVEALLKTIGSFTGIVYTVLLLITDSMVNFNSCLSLTAICAVICLSGIADILINKTKLLPPGLDYCLNSMSYFVQALIFGSQYLTGEYLEDQDLYCKYLSVTAFCIGLSIILEHKFHRSFLVALSRLYFVFLLGTWIIQCDISVTKSHPVGKHVVSTRNSDNNNNSNDVSVTLKYTWHCIGVILLLSLTCGLWTLVYRKCCPLQKGDIDLELMKAPKFVRNRETAVIRLTNLRVSSDSTDDEKLSDGV